MNCGGANKSTLEGSMGAHRVHVVYHVQDVGLGSYYHRNGDEQHQYTADEIPCLIQDHVCTHQGQDGGQLAKEMVNALGATEGKFHSDKHEKEAAKRALNQGPSMIIQHTWNLKNTGYHRGVADGPGVVIGHEPQL
ncbi:hypothetical protein H920_02683 [Fukomys damarensis]|uniref:Uncharacterized protein n=1 Tax=Fukomys damarensis TaxID=885580 RepID=A0A091E019_FUKDA|nr:hypothetical protein H920_02683 [Fukomys damarensis]